MNGDDTSAFPKPITIASILDRVHKGQIMLPRFQRKIAWDEGTSAMLMESLLKGNPVGLFLTLEVGTGEKVFRTREISDAPKPTCECKELLLDGQQRVMSLYRAVKGKFAKPFIVEFKQVRQGKNSGYEINVHQAKKLKKDGGLDIPEGVTDYFFPAKLLSWDLDAEAEATEWIKGHTEKHGLETGPFREAYWHIKTRFLHFQVPVIRLPKTTTREHAINIFIQMNQSVAKLSAFDIAVAQMEEEVGESLHERVDKIAEETQLLYNPSDNDAKKDAKIGSFALRVFCLRKNLPPTDGKFTNLDFREVDENWPDFEYAVKRMKKMLSQEKIWDRKRLPSLVPLHVIVALFMDRPSPDGEGQYLNILKKYLWRAFLSDRYSYAANKKMKEDYDSLSTELNKSDLDKRTLRLNVPIFGNSVKLPEIEDIKEAGWPGGADRVGKGIFILTLGRGAKDIATGFSPGPDTPAKNYQYHHIYPKAYMKGTGSPLKENIDSALNCMFLEGPTNILLGDKSPYEYLNERMNFADDIADKLKTHIVPIDELLESKPRENGNKKERESNFRDFIEERAKEIRSEIHKVCKL